MKTLKIINPVRVGVAVDAASVINDLYTTVYPGMCKLPKNVAYGTEPYLYNRPLLTKTLEKYMPEATAGGALYDLFDVLNDSDIYNPDYRLSTLDETQDSLFYCLSFGQFLVGSGKRFTIGLSFLSELDAPPTYSLNYLNEKANDYLLITFNLSSFQSVSGGNVGISSHYPLFASVVPFSNNVGVGDLKLSRVLPYPYLERFALDFPSMSAKSKQNLSTLMSWYKQFIYNPINVQLNANYEYLASLVSGLTLKEVLGTLESKMFSIDSISEYEIKKPCVPIGLLENGKIVEANLYEDAKLFTEVSNSSEIMACARMLIDSDIDFSLLALRVGKYYSRGAMDRLAVVEL